MIRLNLEYVRSMGLTSTWQESSEERLAILESMGYEVVCPSADTQITGAWFLLKHGMNSTSCSAEHIPRFFGTAQREY